MGKKILGRSSTHWIKDDVNAFTARKFNCWNEVGITSYQNELVNLFLECHR